jgi:hypothetical protein
MPDRILKLCYGSMLLGCFPNGCDDHVPLRCWTRFIKWRSTRFTGSRTCVGRYSRFWPSVDLRGERSAPTLAKASIILITSC